jgi:hypothetical protein
MLYDSEREKGKERESGRGRREEREDCSKNK